MIFTFAFFLFFIFFLDLDKAIIVGQYMTYGTICYSYVGTIILHQASSRR